MNKKSFLLCFYLFLGVVACNHSPSDTEQSVSSQICAYQNIYSENQLLQNSGLLPTFQDAVVVTLQGGGEIHAISYQAPEDTSFYLSLNTDKVVLVTLEDEGGKVRGSLRSNQLNDLLTVEAGNYLLKIYENQGVQGRLVIQPGGCETESLITKQNSRYSLATNYSNPGVYINELSVSQTILPAQTSVTAFIGAVPQGILNEAIEVTSWADYVNYFGGLHNNYPLSYSVYAFYQMGGGNAYVVGVTDAVSPPIVSDLLGVGGMRAVESVNPSPNLYVFPDLINLNNTEFTQFAQTAVPYINELKGMLILDPPQGMDSPEELIALVQQALANLSLESAAFYYPYINILNPQTNQDYTLGPAGMMAGVYAYSDNNSGVWNAPANFNLNVVRALSYDLSDIENAELDDVGVNALRSIADRGYVVWGSRTLAPDNENFRYINLRRLYLYIQQSVSQGLTWIIFEANDVELWADIVNIVSNFMSVLFQEGAFAGSTASESYQVICSFQNNTVQDILNGYLNLTIDYAPVYPSDFMEINLEFQMQSSAQ